MATATATKRTTKATSKRNEAKPTQAEQATQAAKPTKATEPKCAHSRKQVGKPQAKMLRTISWIGTHPGKALRIKRWDRYAKGMTLQHCKETDGLDHLDVLFYVEHGLMKLQDPTQKQVDAAVDQWSKAKAKAA